MKMKFMVVLSMLLVLSLMSTSALAATTEAKVAFEDGPPEIGNPVVGQGMNIDFGMNYLPTHPQAYPSINGPHTLRIMDPRLPGEAGGWSVSVALGTFDTDPAASTFSGEIKLTSPTGVTAGLTPETSVSIKSGVPAVSVVTAAAGLSKGDYDVTWAKSDVNLVLDQAAVDAITGEATYTAELTWTLTP